MTSFGRMKNLFRLSLIFTGQTEKYHYDNKKK